LPKKNPSALSDRLKAIKDRPPPDYEAARGSKRSERAATFKQATLTLEHGERLAVVIKNLSRTGARVEFFQNRDLEVGDYVRLSEQSTALKRGARVIWKRPGLVGLKFTAE
jgi:hypothetical protein